MPKVVVIGLGIAGVNACFELTRSGIEVVAIEARNRIGGRIHSIYLPDGSVAEVGANCLHGRGGMLTEKNPLIHTCMQYGVKRVIEKRIRIINSSGVKEKLGLRDAIKFGIYHQEFLQIEKRIAKLGRHLINSDIEDDMSLLDALAKIGYNHLNKLQLSEKENYIKNCIYNAFEARVCASLDTVSIKELFRRKYFKGKNEIVSNGFERIVRAIFNDALGTGLMEYYLNTPVLEIKYGGRSKAIVKCESGVEVEADAIICTLPIGVLKSGSIQFSPELPYWMKNSINNLGMGMHNKVVLSFNKCFWNPTLQRFIIKEKNIFFRNLYPITGSKSLIINFYGEEALRNSEENVSISIELLDKTFKEDFEHPNYYFVSNWHNDPYSYGSYSYHPIGSSINDTYNLRKLTGNLFFAGEATNEYRAVHGAYMSGIQVVERVRNYLKL